MLKHITNPKNDHQFVDATRPVLLAKDEKLCCRFCGGEIKSGEFRDDLSAREFNISGMCQSCQDKTFGA